MIIGDILESSAAWLAISLPVAASAAKALGVDSATLSLVLRRFAQYIAGALVTLAIQKGWLTPDNADASTAWLVEKFVIVATLVAGAIWAHSDTKREVKSVDVEKQKHAAEQWRARAARALPAGASWEEIDQHARQLALDYVLAQRAERDAENEK